MTILSITVSIEDNKLLYLKRTEEEGEIKFSCHHFPFDANNHAEVTLDEKGVIKSITPCKRSNTREKTTLSSSRAVPTNDNKLELKFDKNNRGSVVIIDVESFLQREVIAVPGISQSTTTSLPSLEIEEKLIISIERGDNDLQDLKLHVKKLTLESA